MYLLEFDTNGVIYKITPDVPLRTVGMKVDKLPCTIEQLLVTFNEVELDNKKYYIKKENE